MLQRKTRSLTDIEIIPLIISLLAAALALLLWETKRETCGPLHILDGVSGNPAPVVVWEVDILQAGEERASEGPCRIPQHLWEHHEEDGDRLFTTERGRRERISEQISGKHVSFSGKSTNRRGCPEKVFQTQLDKALCNLIWPYSWPLLSTMCD